MSGTEYALALSPDAVSEGLDAVDALPEEQSNPILYTLNKQRSTFASSASRKLTEVAPPHWSLATVDPLAETEAKVLQVVPSAMP